MKVDICHLLYNLGYMVEHLLIGNLYTPTEFMHMHLNYIILKPKTKSSYTIFYYITLVSINLVKHYKKINKYNQI